MDPELGCSHETQQMKAAQTEKRGVNVYSRPCCLTAGFTALKKGARSCLYGTVVCGTRCVALCMVLALALFRTVLFWFRVYVVVFHFKS